MKALISRIALRRKWALIILALLVVSCTRNDRVAIVACDESRQTPLSVEAKIPFGGSLTSVTGYLNTWNLYLGALVQLSPDLSSVSLIAQVPQSAVSANVLSRRYEYVDAKLVANVFHVYVESDMKSMAKQYDVKLDYDRLIHPTLDLDTPVVNSIMSIDSLMNADKALVEIIRKSKGVHYALVSRTIDGDDINLFFDLSQPVVNRYEINGTNLHVSYVCASVNEIRIRRQAKGGPVPIIIFLSPIIYDELGARLTTDTEKKDALKNK